MYHIRLQSDTHACTVSSAGTNTGGRAVLSPGAVHVRGCCCTHSRAGCPVLHLKLPEVHTVLQRCIRTDCDGPVQLALYKDPAEQARTWSDTCTGIVPDNNLFHLLFAQALSQTTTCCATHCLLSGVRHPTSPPTRTRTDLSAHSPPTCCRAPQRAHSQCGCQRRSRSPAVPI